METYAEDYPLKSSAAMMDRTPGLHEVADRLEKVAAALAEGTLRLEDRLGAILYPTEPHPLGRPEAVRGPMAPLVARLEELLEGLQQTESRLSRLSGRVAL